MVNSDSDPNSDFDNWRQEVAAEESNIESLEADERIVQKNSDGAMRNAMLHLAFFVAFTNGLAVLFTRGANLSCVWFSVVSGIIAGMFLLGMVLPIWFGFRQMRRYRDKLQNCVARRRVSKTVAINLLERYGNFERLPNQGMRDQNTLDSVQRLQVMRDSEFLIQDQEKLYKRLFVLMLVCAFGYALIFPFVAHSVFCNGKNDIAQPPFPTHFQQAQIGQQAQTCQIGDDIDGMAEVDGQITFAQQMEHCPVSRST